MLLCKYVDDHLLHCGANCHPYNTLQNVEVKLRVHIKNIFDYELSYYCYSVTIWCVHVCMHACTHVCVCTCFRQLCGVVSVSVHACIYVHASVFVFSLCSVCVVELGRVEVERGGNLLSLIISSENHYQRLLLPVPVPMMESNLK